MAWDRILAMVLAGGEGMRLAPLTAERSMGERRTARRGR